MPDWLSTDSTAPNPRPVASRREQRVRVGVGHVHVDAPPAANHVLAVAAQVVSEADARLPVVLVVLRILAEVLEPRMPVSWPARPAVLNEHEVRVERLIELVAVDQVLAEPEVQGEPPVSAQSSCT